MIHEHPVDEAATPQANPVPGRAGAIAAADLARGTQRPVSRPLRFVRRGEIVTLHNVPADRTLLDLLRDDLGCSGTKEGCGEGDCGACTVVLGESGGDGDTLQYRAINSCIRLAHSIDGLALWTVEDIDADRPGFLFGQTPDGSDQAESPPFAGQAGLDDLHPAQQAMVHCHGSQCGFCTPGFVMSLFGLYQQCQPTVPVGAGSAGGAAVTVPISRHDAQIALSGNLCRCTGYRPILDAAQQLHRYTPQWVDEGRIGALLARIAPQRDAHVDAAEPDGTSVNPSGGASGSVPDAAYLSPTSLAALLQARAALPQAQLVAGTTDVGLWITKQHRRFDRILDVTAARELRQVERTTGADGGPVLVLGAAVRLADAFAVLAEQWPQLRIFTQRFAGLPVRNSGTLGGNIANGSPIGDSMPLLIALNATVVLASVRGRRELPLESLYTGYRRNVMAADEILAFVKILLPTQAAGTPWQSLLRAYKISKRFDDDISAVCLVLNLSLDRNAQTGDEAATIKTVSIGAGGVAATPVRARATEAALIGQPWTADTVHAAMHTLRQEFQPISDMRASGDYRRAVLSNLLWRFWLETGQSLSAAGHAVLNLDDHHLGNEGSWT